MALGGLLGRKKKANDEPVDEFSESMVAARRKYENLHKCRTIWIFMLFLITFTWVVLIGESATSPQLADSMRRRVADGLGPQSLALEEVTKQDKIWEYLNRTLVPAIFDVNPDPTQEERLRMELSALPVIDLANHLHGSIKFRQIRVTKETNCQAGALFAAYVTECYPPMNEGTESAEDYGPESRFQWVEDTGSTDHTGQLASYGPAGYVEYLPADRRLMIAKVEELKVAGFLDAATRAVFLEFTVFNANVGSYAVIRITTEFTSTGTAIPSFRVLILSQDRLTPAGMGTMGELLQPMGLGVLLIFVMYYFVEEAFELRVAGISYFKDLWNILDWINIILLLVSIGIRMSLYISAAGMSINGGTFNDPYEFTNLQGLAEQAALFRLVNAFNAVILWCKTSKYLIYVPYLKTAMKTMSRALQVLVPLLILLFVALMGYCLAYYMAFGAEMEDLSTFWSVALFFLRSWIRDADVLPIYFMSPIYGSAMILSFYVAVLLIGTSTLFAIMADAMRRERVKEKARELGQVNEAEAEEEQADDPVGEVQRSILSFLDRCTRPSPFLRRLLKSVTGIALPDVPVTSEPDPDEEAKKNRDKRKSRGSVRRLTDGSMLEAAMPDLKSSIVKPPPALMDDDKDSDDSSESPQAKKKEPVKAKPIGEYSTSEILQSVDQMSGRMLSKIQSISIETSTEVNEICEKLGLMQMVVDELTLRVDSIAAAQEDMMQPQEE